MVFDVCSFLQNSKLFPKSLWFYSKVYTFVKPCLNLYLNYPPLPYPYLPSLGVVVNPTPQPGMIYDPPLPPTLHHWAMTRPYKWCVLPLASKNYPCTTIACTHCVVPPPVSAQQWLLSLYERSSRFLTPGNPHVVFGLQEPPTRVEQIVVTLAVHQPGSFSYLPLLHQVTTNQ